jgi:hypothetical protein
MTKRKSKTKCRCERPETRVVNDGKYDRTEVKCNECDEWVDEEVVLWATKKGVLDTEKGLPWCEGCCPEQPDYD